MNPRNLWLSFGLLIAAFFLRAAPAHATWIVFDKAGNMVGSMTDAQHASASTSAGVNATSSGKALVPVGGTKVPVPVSATASVSRAAIARNAARMLAVLGPVGDAVALGIVAGQLGLKLCQAGGLCRDFSQPQTDYWATNGGVQVHSSSAQGVCDIIWAGWSQSNKDWYRGLNAMYETEGRFDCRSVSHDAYIPGYKTPNAYCSPGNHLSGGQCVRDSDGGPAEQPISEAETEQALADKMAAEEAWNKRIYDAAAEDFRKLDEARQADFAPAPPDTPVSVNAPPVSTPEKLKETTKKPKPDGSTDTVTKTEKTVITPKIEGSTVGDSKVSFSSQTVITTTTINNITNNTTVEETVLENDAGEEDRDDSFTDPDMPEVPDLYEQKYPDGIEGVWRDHKPDIASTQFWQGIKQMFPTFGGGQCPAWSMSFNILPGANYGSMPFDVPCWIFQAVGLILLTTAAFTARKIIF